MVICIEDFLQKVQPCAFLATEVAASLEWIGTEPDDDGPDHDPPSFISMAA